MADDNKPHGPNNYCLECYAEGGTCGDREWVGCHMEDRRAAKARQVNSVPATFVEDLATVINSHSMENGSDTPNFILAEYLRRCLVAFDKEMRAESDTPEALFSEVIAAFQTAKVRRHSWTHQDDEVSYE